GCGRGCWAWMGASGRGSALRVSAGVPSASRLCRAGPPGTVGGERLGLLPRTLEGTPPLGPALRGGGHDLVAQVDALVAEGDAAGAVDHPLDLARRLPAEGAADRLFLL